MKEEEETIEEKKGRRGNDRGRERKKRVWWSRGGRGRRSKRKPWRKRSKRIQNQQCIAGGGPLPSEEG